MPTNYRITVSRSRKVNLGNYESADAFASISVDLNPGDAIPETFLAAWATVQREVKNQECILRSGDDPMRIKSLVNITPQFPEGARAYKGRKKTDPKQPGKDLKYFRVVFDDTPEGNRSAELFKARYGNEPTAISGWLMIDSIEKLFPTCFEIWRGAQGRGKCIHRCDGETCSHPPELAGKPCTEQANPDHKPVGRLHLTPHLDRAMDMLFITHSWNDLRNILQNLEMIENTFGHLMGIPVVVSRKPRMVQTPAGVFEKWLIFVEVDQVFMENKFAAMREQGNTPLLEGVNENDESEYAALPAGEHIDTETGEILDGDFSEPEKPADVPPSPDPHEDEVTEPIYPVWWDEPAYKQKKPTGKTNAQEFLSKAEELGVDEENASALARDALVKGWTVAGAFRKLKALSDGLAQKEDEIPEDSDRPAGVVNDWNTRHALTARLTADYKLGSFNKAIDLLNAAYRAGAFSNLDITDDDIVTEAFAAWYEENKTE